MSETVTGLALLRTPFPPHQISKLPKPLKKDAEKGKCRECGGWHGLPAVHLDYVGHAALTDRLLDADPAWTWEPIADPASIGLPTATGGMWIRLTVCGVSRLGFGHPDGKTGGDAVKEVIGDALRNAAMRFGAALDLWHKGDLHVEEAGEEKETAAPNPPEGYAAWIARLEAAAVAGMSALTAEWGAAPAGCRVHINNTDRAKWDTLKAVAAGAQESAA